MIHAEACPELKAFCEYLDLPVSSTLMGLGNFLSDYRLSLGMPGTGYANLALYNSDVLICVGCRLNDRVTGKLEAFAPGAKLVHIDVDASEISKCLSAVVPIVVTCVGLHRIFTAQYYNFKKPRTLITSGGLGTMGFVLPAAIGVKMAMPQRKVVCIDGDSSFLMNVQELYTAVRYRIPVVVAVLKNHNLGMMGQWQHIFFEQRHSHSNLACPLYDQVANAFGALGRRLERPEELAKSLR